MRQVAAAAQHYVIAVFWEAYAWIRPKIILWRPIKFTYHEISESLDKQQQQLMGQGQGIGVRTWLWKRPSIDIQKHTHTHLYTLVYIFVCKQTDKITENIRRTVPSANELTV